MSFPKIVNQMGSFGEKRKKMFFRFCRPILDIFGFPLLSDEEYHSFYEGSDEEISDDEKKNIHWLSNVLVLLMNF